MMNQKVKMLAYKEDTDDKTQYKIVEKNQIGSFDFAGTGMVFRHNKKGEYDGVRLVDKWGNFDDYIDYEGNCSYFNIYDARVDIEDSGVEEDTRWIIFTDGYGNSIEGKYNGISGEIEY